MTREQDGVDKAGGVSLVADARMRARPPPPKAVP